METKLPQETLNIINKMNTTEEKKNEAISISTELYIDLQRAPAFLLQMYLLEAVHAFAIKVDEDITKFYPITKSLTDKLHINLTQE